MEILEVGNLHIPLREILNMSLELLGRSTILFGEGIAIRKESRRVPLLGENGRECSDGIRKLVVLSLCLSLGAMARFFAGAGRNGTRYTRSVDLQAFS